MRASRALKTWFLDSARNFLSSEVCLNPISKFYFFWRLSPTSASHGWKVKRERDGRTYRRTDGHEFASSNWETREYLMAEFYTGVCVVLPLALPVSCSWPSSTFAVFLKILAPRDQKNTRSRGTNLFRHHRSASPAIVMPSSKIRL